MPWEGSRNSKNNWKESLGVVKNRGICGKGGKQGLWWKNRAGIQDLWAYWAMMMGVGLWPVFVALNSENGEGGKTMRVSFAVRFISPLWHNSYLPSLRLSFLICKWG